MTTRWEVEDAVLTSEIEPTGRHILLTLLSRTNAATAEIPHRHAPSFTELELLTGYSRSTLIEWMKALTESHWISRPILDGDVRPGMRLAIGEVTAARPKRSRKSKPMDAAYRLAVQRGESRAGGAIPPGGTVRTAWRYSTVPPGGTDAKPLLLMNFPTESSNPSTNLDQVVGAAVAPDDLGLDFGPKAEAPKRQKPKAKRAKPAPEDAGETKGQQLNRVTKLYTDHVKPSNFFKAKSVVESAFDASFSEEQICAGIAKLVEKGDPLTKDSIRIAIKGPPSWAVRNANSNQRSTYVRMTNSHDPSRDYTENY